MEKLNITREEFRKVIEEVVLESGKEVGILNEIDKILPGILILNNKSIKIVLTDNIKDGYEVGELL